MGKLKFNTSPFRKKHSEELNSSLVLGGLILLLYVLFYLELLINPFEGLFEQIFNLVFLFAALDLLITGLLQHLPYTKKIDLTIMKNEITVPNPPLKEIILSKNDDPYSIPYNSIKRIKKDKEVTLRMKLKGKKEPKKVCIIEKKNGNKIKIRPDYLAGDFDEFVDKLIEVYDQRKGEDH